MDQEKRKLVQSYVDHGWSLVPIPKGSKAPGGKASKGWQKKHITDPSAIGDGNVGILLGEPSSWLIDIDLDWPEAVELADEFLPDTGAIFGRPGNPRSHWLYIVTGAKTRTWQIGKKTEGGMIVELRSTSHQTVFPPSVHPSGETIAWDAYTEPLKVEQEMLERACAWLAAAALVSKNWADGSRQDIAFGLAGLLLKSGEAESAVEHFIQTVAEHAGDDEVEKRVGAVSRTASAIAADRETAGYTTLLEIWGKDVAQRVSRWLTGDSDGSAIRLAPGRLPEIVDEAEIALLEKDPNVVFQRGNILVRMVYEARPPEEQGEIVRSDGAPTLIMVNAPWLRENLMKSVQFKKYDGRTKDWRLTDCPQDVAITLLSRVGQWRALALKAIVQAPTLRRDGSLVDAAGYDENTGVFLVGEGPWPSIPSKPTRKAARMALDKLSEPFATFPFDSEPDRNVLIAAIITALIRWRLPAAPLFGFDAPTPGTGKSKLAGSVSIIATGHPASAMTYTGDAEELRKRLTSTLLAGDTLLLLDNVRTPLTGDALCSILTETSYKDRILGASRIVELPTACTMLASGNNLTALDDMARRMLTCRIDAKVEHPEDRKFKTDITELVTELRPELIAHALTIVRAYIEAEQPELDLVSVGGFETWDKSVRRPIVWAGGADPMDTQRRLRESDPITDQLEGLLTAWYDALQEEPTTIRAALTAQGSEGVDCPVAEAAMQITGDRDPERINTLRLGQFIRRHAGRPRNGLRFTRGAERGGSLLWKVVKD